MGEAKGWSFKKVVALSLSHWLFYSFFHERFSLLGEMINAWIPLILLVLIKLIENVHILLEIEGAFLYEW